MRGKPHPILACETLSLFGDALLFLHLTFEMFRTGVFFSIPQPTQSFAAPVPA